MVEYIIFPSSSEYSFLMRNISKSDPFPHWLNDSTTDSAINVTLRMSDRRNPGVCHTLIGPKNLGALIQD